MVLAVSYPHLEDIAVTYGDELTGRTVVGITNSVDFGTFNSLVVSADSSATAELAGFLPSAKVLKAFTTDFAATLGSTSVGTHQTTVFVAGDDTDAKDFLSEVVKAGGMDAVDAGPLGRARELEALGFLQLPLTAGEQIQWPGGFALVHQDP